MDTSFKVFVPERGFVWRVAHWLKDWAQKHAANELVANSICLYPAQFCQAVDESTSEELMTYLNAALAAGWRFENARIWWPHPEEFCPGGYNWSIDRTLKAKATKNAVATLSEIPRSNLSDLPISRSFREFDLMDDKYKALFMTFKDLPATAQAILEFANQHGCLGDMFPREVSRNDVDTLSRWQFEVISMRQAFEIYELLKKVNKANRESTLLARHFKWQIHKTEKAKCVIFDSHPELDARAIPQFPECRMIKAICWEGDPRWVELQDKNPKTAAQWLIREIINKHITIHADSILAWVDEAPKARPRKGTKIMPGNVGLTRLLSPRNLLGAMWVQFENYVLGDMQFKKCPRDGCPYWFEGKSNKEYCGALCRKKANRKDHEDMQKMYADGKSIKLIAKKFSTEEERVKEIVQ